MSWQQIILVIYFVLVWLLGTVNTVFAAADPTKKTRVWPVAVNFFLYGSLIWMVATMGGAQ